MPNKALPFRIIIYRPGTLIGRPAIVSAAHKDGSVIGLHPGIGQIPRGSYRVVGAQIS
jgi:hypothetical protein